MTRLHYELAGKGHPLVLIAGYSCNIRIWDTIREELSKRFHLLLFDNRGVGKSAPTTGSYSIEDMAEDVLSLIHQLKLEKPHILGHSMGSLVAQTLARQHSSSIGKMVLANSRLKISPRAIATNRFFLQMRKKGAPPSLIAEGVMPWLYSEEFIADSKNIENFTSKASFCLSEKEQERQFQALHQFDSRSWFRSILSEMLILCGEKDILTPPDDFIPLMSSMPRAKFLSIPAMGHLFHIEKPKEFIRIISDFLI